MFDMDVIAHECAQELCCCHVLFIRKGRIIGTRSYFTKLSEIDGDDPLTAFVTQFYLSESRASMYPKEIILDDKIEEPEVITEAVKTLLKRNPLFNLS